jgi:ubiquinone/menaquinone biosynthesis C-methylase UbiE
LSAATYGSVELALAYEELSDPQFTHGRELIALLGVSDGDRVLDIGCGTGRLAAFAVERLNASGRLVGIDPASPRVDLARRRSDARLDFRIGAAQDLSAFADATFDVAYLNSVLNWIDDRPQALSEAKRVLRPGGRFGIATTIRDRPNQLRMLERRAWRIAKSRADESFDASTDGQLPEEGGSRRAATADDIRGMVERAGFILRLFEVRTFTALFRDVAQIIDFSQATTYGQFAPGTDARDLSAFREAMEKLLAGEYAHCVTAAGIRLERYVLLAVALKPR